MRPFLLFATAVACLALPLLSVAQEKGKTDKGFTLGAFYGRGYPIIGSEVTRKDWGVNIAYGKPEPHFRVGKLPAQLVYEGYYFGTRSEGIDAFPPFTQSIFGGLAYSRWFWPRRHGVGAYFDAGIGLIYSDRSNRDLDSRIDSTPYLGGGFTLPASKGQWMIGAAFLHMSNAGTKGNNQGINNLLLTVRYRF